MSPSRAAAVLMLLLPAVVQPARSEVALPDLREIRAETQRLARGTESLGDLVARSLARRAGLEASLTEAQSQLETPVDVESLRRARLDLDNQNARVTVIDGQLEQRAQTAERLHATLAAIEERLDALEREGQEPAIEHLRLRTAVGLLEVQREALEANADRLRRLSLSAHRIQALYVERLRLLQRRFDPRAIEGRGLDPHDPRKVLLQRVISDILDLAVRTERAASEVQGDGPEAEERRRTLSLHVDDAVSRGFLRQADLAILEAAGQLQGLAALREDDTMPLPVLRSAQGQLADLQALVDSTAENLETQRRVTESRLAALRRSGEEDTKASAMAADLQSLMRYQEADLKNLGERLAAEREAFERVVAEADAAAMLVSAPLPSAPEDWQRIRSGAAQLPSLILHALDEAVGTVRARLEELGHERLGLLAASVPAILLLAVWGGRRLDRIAERAPQEAHAFAAVLASLSAALPTAIPLALWVAMGLALALPREVLDPGIAVLAIWPVLVFMLNLARRALVRDAPAAGDVGLGMEGPQMLQIPQASDAAIGPGPADLAAGPAAMPAQPAPHRDRLVLYRRLRAGFLVAAAIALLRVLTHTLPLGPPLADALDRLAFAGFLLLIVPALALRELASRRSHDPGDAHRWRWIALLAQALPLVIGVTGVIGLAGYINLAWTISGYFLWLMLVSIGLYFVVGLIGSLEHALGERIAAADAERAPFWRSHFLEPSGRLAFLAALVGSGWLLYGLWGWTAQTPAVRWVRGVLETVLFEAGGAPFTLGDILISLALVGAALWVGGWSQQVSYQLAYRKVRDVGLRQALATFTQYVVIVAGVLLALKIIGFDLTTLTVFMASLGVGIGFGMQNIVNNFVSGVLLLAERPLKLGDYVAIGNQEGNVTQIGIRSLTVRTPDNQDVVIPNGNVISGSFTNWTRGDDTVRQVHYLTLRFASDRERAMQIVRDVLDDDPHVLKQPASGVYLWKYSEYGPVLRLQFCFRFVEGPGGLLLRSKVLLEIGRRFDAAGIQFAELQLPEESPAAAG